MESKRIYLLFLLLAFIRPIFTQDWQIEPHEYLIIAFEDSTGAKDTVIVGFYYDPNYFIGNSIVSIGIDSVFGEVNMPEEVTDTNFLARVERRFGDMVPYDTIDYETFLKTDIRFNDEACDNYSPVTYNDFKVRFYNYSLPIIFGIQVMQNEEYDQVNYKGCFCENPVESSWSWDNQCDRSSVYASSQQFEYSDTIFCLEMDHFGIDIFRYNVGIEDKKNSGEPVIYPIPVMELLAINSDFIFNGIRVLDVFGRTVFVENDNMIKSLDVRNYSSGVYIIELRTQDSKIFTSKFIKQ